MQREQVIDFALALDLGPPDFTRERAGWLNYSCPLAIWTHSGKKDTSKGFGISVSADERSHCFCLACHFKGTFASLAYELGHRRGISYVNVAKEIEYQELFGSRFVAAPWKGDVIQEEDNAETHQLPRPEEEYSFPLAAGSPYLRARGISVRTAISLGLRWDSYQRRILFPVRTGGGRFAGFSGRRVDPPFGHDSDGRPRERNGDLYLKVRDYFGLRKRLYVLHRYAYGSRRHIFGDSRRISSNKSANGIVGEGLFDYARFAELVPKYAPFAILGSYIHEEQARILVSFGIPLTLFFDNDKAGQDVRMQAIDVLFGKVPLLDVTYPEGYDGADPGSLPDGVLRSMIKNAKLITKKPSLV